MYELRYEQSSWSIGPLRSTEMEGGRNLYHCMYDGKQQYKRYLPSCSLLLTNDYNFITLEPESQKVVPVKLLLFRTSYSTYSEESPPGTFTPTVGNSNQKMSL